ncbi:hypothetical protein BGZ58_006460 [Dissophora ornata]|nr:hypothetical protein BGZ58_006460 [Dissophora ornata]
MQEASREAACTKRKGPGLVGSYIERLDRMGLEHLSDTDRVILDYFCPRLKIKDAEDKDDGIAEEEEEEDRIDLDGKGKEGKGTEQLSLLWSILTCPYSGNYPRNVGIGKKVNAFISRLQRLGLHTPPRSRSELSERSPFTPTDLVRSVAVQFTTELKRMYSKGSYELYKKIQEDVSAVENFVSPNKMSQNPRKIAPITKSEQPFVGFSERELAGVFFKQGGELKGRLVELASGRSRRETEYMIKQFIADIDPDNLTSRQREKAGCRAAIKLLPLKNL